MGAYSTLRAAEPAAAMDPSDVLAKLVAGNERFANGKTKVMPRTPADFARDAKGQAPPAIILACADSRVAPELVFDQPIGGLFVLRVAGNIVGSGPTLMGSIEYAVAVLGSSLIMVMGHSSCGACEAAIEHIENNESLPGSIEGLVDYIRPVVRQVKGKPGDKLVNVTKANAVQTAMSLETSGPILPERVKSGALKIVSSYYELSNGQVQLLKS
ncbi:carbonic anhydrase [Blastopirellula marina]|nr:carbonic anhydrase [Blastopirellula marina]